MSSMLQGHQENGDWERRALQESAEQAEMVESKAFEEIMAQTRKEAEEKAKKEEEEQLSHVLEFSKSDIPKGDFACEEDEEAYIARLTQQTMREYLDVQKARGAVADDDCKTIEEVTHRSMKDYHKMTWNNEPPPEAVWIGRDANHPGDKESDKGKYTEQGFYAQQQYYSMQHGFQSMSISRTGFETAASINSGQGWFGFGHGGFPAQASHTAPPSQPPSPSIAKPQPTASSGLKLSSSILIPPELDPHTLRSSSFPSTSPEMVAHGTQPCPSIQDCAKPDQGTGNKIVEYNTKPTEDGNSKEVEEKEDKTDDRAEESDNKSFLKSKHVAFLDKFGQN